MKKILLLSSLVFASFHVNAASLQKDSDKVAYAYGAELGNKVLKQTKKYSDAGTPISKEHIVAGFVDMLSGNPQLSDKDRKVLLANLDKILERKTLTNKTFLEENKKNNGVIETRSGLQYQYQVRASGNKKKYPTKKDRVTVHYVGTLIDGTEFDSSIKRGRPATFGLNQVISGWTEGLQLMSEGDIVRFFIPSNLGYGSRATDSIPADSTLIFDVELIKIN